MNTRLLIAKTLKEWELEECPIHILMQRNVLKLDSQDEIKLYKKIVFGVIENKNILDEYILSLTNRKQTKLHIVVKIILRMSVYQKYFLSEIPDYAIANESVKIAKKMTHKGNVGFINAVIRKMLITPLEINRNNLESVEELSNAYDYPKWMINNWILDYGIDTTKKILKQFSKPSHLFLRCNSNKIKREDLILLLKDEGIDARASELYEQAIICKKIGKTFLNKYFEKGYFSVQDISSMLVASIVELKKDDVFVDMCCAPGGKLSHIAEKFRFNQLYGYDLTKEKIEKVKNQINRLELYNIKLNVLDSRKLNDCWDENVDFILLDAPCSGTGVIGRKPDIKRFRKESDINNLVKIQLELLETAYKCLKKGGFLLYSTCSIEKVENEIQFKLFLDRHKDMEPVSIKEIELEARSLKEGFIQILPHHYDTDGFFISLCRKK